MLVTYILCKFSKNAKRFVNSRLQIIGGQFSMDNKLYYEAPSIIVIEVKTEGIVCVSQEDYDYANLDG